MSSDDKRKELEKRWDKDIGWDEHEGKLMGQLFEDYTIHIQNRKDNNKRRNKMVYLRSQMVKLDVLVVVPFVRIRWQSRLLTWF